MPVLRFLLDLVKGTARYLVVVAGGLTLFLIMAPVFGYLPYSDRPGPGWFGQFPAIGWEDFWVNARAMLTTGAFIAVLIAVGGAFSVLVIQSAERLHAPRVAVRVGGAIVTGCVTAYFVLGAGWYVAMGVSAWIVSILLGLGAGAWVLPSRAPKGNVGA